MSASSVCTPSRAALLTGSYPKRLSMAKGVLFPTSTTGLHPDEHTIGDHLKQHGYATIPKPFREPRASMPTSASPIRTT